MSERQISKSVSQRFPGVCFVVLRSLTVLISVSYFFVIVVLCFEMNAGRSTVLALTRPAKWNAMRDIGIESCSEGQKFDFRHHDRLGVLFVRPHVDCMQSQRNEEVESVSVFWLCLLVV